VARRVHGQTQAAVLPRSPASHRLASAATVMARRAAPPVARARSFACASDGNFRIHSPIPIAAAGPAPWQGLPLRFAQRGAQRGGVCSHKRPQGGDALLGGPVGGVSQLHFLIGEIERQGEIIDARPVSHEVQVGDRDQLLTAEVDVVAPEVAVHELAGSAGSQRPFRFADQVGEPQRDIVAVDQITEHDKGLVLTLTRSTTNQCGDQTELVVVPQGATKPLSGYGSSHLAGRCGGSVTDRCFVQSARATEHYLAA
jgi:hypothetical protein